MKSTSTSYFSHTVAAVSTPYGRGGIAVVRISGDDALKIADRIFRPAKNASLKSEDTRVTLCDTAGYTAVYGSIVFPNGDFIDDGIATVFRGPHSFTGEDTVELSCHGGLLLPQKVLSAAIAAGAEYAGAGEFTKRAFVNGKISLSSAEAVIELIDAQTEEQLKLARSHKNGVFSRAVNGIYYSLLSLLSETYVTADYPDEDLNELSIEEFLQRLEDAKKEVDSLADSYRIGRVINEGVYTVLAGKPNTGKSSLLNRILGKSRAIVSPLAGTTRDYIEEKTTFGGVLMNLVDTAGLHKAGDEIERNGIARSLDALKRADLILAMFDLSGPLDSDDIDFARSLEKYPTAKIALFNKSDIKGANESEVYLSLSKIFDRNIVISAESGQGIDTLENTVGEMFSVGEIDYDTTAVTANARQNALLLKASESLSRALEALKDGMSADVAGLDIEEALSFLGQTDGRKVTEEIVDNIFHRFCVGK